MTLNTPSLVIPGKLLEHMAVDGGRLAFSHNPDLISDEKWTLGYEFGREAEDSDMAGGAAYGTGRTAADAFGALMKDLSL